MHDATAGVPTEWTLASPFPKEPESHAGRAHRNGLGRDHQCLGARGKRADSCPVGVLVEGGEAVVGAAVGSQKSAVALGCESVDHGSEMLIWKMLHVEGQVGWPSNGEIGSYASTMLSNRSDK